MIRLAAALVPYAALARLIAVLAWMVAALNIMHPLGPTLDFLDSVAIVVSGLRISIPDRRTRRAFSGDAVVGCQCRVQLVRASHYPVFAEAIVGQRAQVAEM